MQLKINNKILSIPPFISTTWSRIASIRMRDNVLSITLTMGETIDIKGLSEDQILEIFSFHAQHLEKVDEGEVRNRPIKDLEFFKQAMFGGEAATINLAFGSVDGLVSGMTHQPEQSDAPDLPKEVIDKIREIVSAIGILDEVSVVDPEPNCNCFHCQITRAFKEELPQQLSHDEEIVQEEDLRFEDWKVQQTGANLFVVVNPLDQQDKYNVYVGDPIGCTCGQQGCEHLIAVLKS